MTYKFGYETDQSSGNTSYLGNSFRSIDFKTNEHFSETSSLLVSPTDLGLNILEKLHLGIHRICITVHFVLS